MEPKEVEALRGRLARAVAQNAKRGFSRMKTFAVVQGAGGPCHTTMHYLLSGYFGRMGKDAPSRLTAALDALDKPGAMVAALEAAFGEGT